MEATGRKGIIVKADLSQLDNIQNLISQGIQHFGKLDILVNNAGIDGKNADFWEIVEADYDAVLNLNLKELQPFAIPISAMTCTGQLNH